MRPYLLICLGVTLLIFSCKKDNSGTSAPVLSDNNNIISFAVNTQLSTKLDYAGHSVTVVIPYTTNRAAANITLAIADDASALINGTKVKSGQLTLDVTKPLTVPVTAANGAVANWTITVATDMEKYGLGSNVTASLSLNKTYSWYIDQYTTGQYWSVNCGPSSVTMAINWADPTFIHTAEDARNTYRSAGGWWYTTDIANYLAKYNIDWRYTPLPDDYQTMKKYLDQGDILILCLDNYYFTYNSDLTEHTGRFYGINAAGSGHFVVVKGYKMVDNKVYFEGYDPWSIGATYLGTGALKGLDRYYTSTDLTAATNVWWDFAIVVAPKGKLVTAATGLKTFANPEQVPAQKGY